MKNLITYLKTLWSWGADSQSSDVSHDCRLTVGSPSGMTAKLQVNSFMRFAVVLTLIFSIGVGNVWGTEETWTHTFSSLPSISAGKFTVNNAEWSVNTKTGKGSPSITTGNDNKVKCMKFGSGSNHYYSNITLSTNYFTDYKVKSIYIVACTNNSGKTVPVTVTQGSGVSAVTIGSASYTVAYSADWQNSSNCQKTINTEEGNGGTLTISISPSACAFSIHQISVTYETPCTPLGTINGSF